MSTPICCASATWLISFLAAGCDLLQQHQLKRRRQQPQLVHVERHRLLKRTHVKAEAVVGVLTFGGAKVVLRDRQHARHGRCLASRTCGARRRVEAHAEIPPASPAAGARCRAAIAGLQNRRDALRVIFSADASTVSSTCDTAAKRLAKCSDSFSAGSQVSRRGSSRAAGRYLAIQLRSAVARLGARSGVSASLSRLASSIR